MLTNINVFSQNSDNLKWYSSEDADFPQIENQGWKDGLLSDFHRLPMRAKSKVRDAVWQLSKKSAGLSLKFSTNSRIIKIRYSLKGEIAMPHMPATGVSGVDLYYKLPKGKFYKCYGNYSINKVTQFNFAVENDMKTDGEYTLFLPLYNEVEKMEIGVEKSAFFRAVPLSERKPIVAYGTSICQGACASRPGMAWTNILQRRLNIPIVNLGFSGNGKLEPALINLMNEIDASVYILDCLPNLDSKKDDVFSLTVNAVKQLRNRHISTPIVLCSHIGYSNAETDKSYRAKYVNLNNDLQKAFDYLISSGYTEIYLITNSELNFNDDLYVDYIHPNDSGMLRYADIYEAVISKLID